MAVFHAASLESHAVELTSAPPQKIASLGFEPSLNESESFVLPLHHEAMWGSGQTHASGIVVLTGNRCKTLIDDVD